MYASDEGRLGGELLSLKAMLLIEREAYRAELREQALRIEQLKQRLDGVFPSTQL
jgi:hypothetical protein